MKPVEQKKAAKVFAEEWAGDFKEDGNTAPFWLSLLRDVYGVEHPERYISFEDTVKHEEKGNSLYVDAWIPSMRVIIEQKNAGAPLDKKYPRHGKMLTPYEQAFEYDQTQPVDGRAKYIITCNFHEFWIYDMNEPEAFRKPIKLSLQELPDHYDQLNFLIDNSFKPTDIKEVKVSVKAGELVGKLYDAFIKVYKQYQPADYTEEDRKKDMHDLNILCVRIVFCLYAEDSGLFGAPEAFRHYLESWKIDNVKKGLQDLFETLDTPPKKRPRFLDPKLVNFPYVNGGLFHDDTVEIPPISQEIYDIICNDMSKGFDWSVISPTIFGAVFESTLNPETRRSGGMHYTSIENIHKVIDPLFLDDLKKELNDIISIPESEKYVARRREITLKTAYYDKLTAFQNKLASLNFLDPACGSGNFLTETFICLRWLENKVIEELNAYQQILDLTNPIKVSIKQFYGIEINDFAVTVAKTALWIAESQMMQETEDIIHKELDFLPLKTNAYIHETNALRVDWNNVIPAEKLSYIMGNPPFVGIRHSHKEHRNDLRKILSSIHNSGSLDYVSAWYVLTATMIQRNLSIRCAFVSTNSIVQGIQATALWQYLIEKCSLKINFAYQTFKWSNEAQNQAAVHCVIVGFSSSYQSSICSLYSDSAVQHCLNINQYLLNAPTVWIKSRKHPLYSFIPDMIKGCYPTDDGNYIFTPDEMSDFVKKEPLSKPFFRRWIGSDDLLKGKERFILFLKNCPPNILRKMPAVRERVLNVASFRSKSTKLATQRKADTPLLLDEERIPNSEFLVVPVVSSENRRYIPAAFFNPPDICYASAFFIEQAPLWLFSIIESNVHMAWMRTVAGRLEMRYRYSNTLVYNTFPWPILTEPQKKRLEKTAQTILDARKLYPNASLADLYDPLTMPPELRKAHQENDKAVMEAYGFNWHTMTEPECVAELMKMYQKLVDIEEK